MSKIFVDTIEPKTSGEVVSINGKKGQVLEILTSLCDGSTVEVASGSYTFQNVTALQDGTTSYVDLTGSTLSYKPPAGTKKVIYEFTYIFARTADTGPLGHHKFFIDDVEATNARWSVGS